jgi:hypothetical protein
VCSSDLLNLLPIVPDIQAQMDMIIKAFCPFVSVSISIYNIVGTFFFYWFWVSLLLWQWQKMLIWMPKQSLIFRTKTNEKRDDKKFVITRRSCPDMVGLELWGALYGLFEFYPNDK